MTVKNAQIATLAISVHNCSGGILCQNSLIFALPRNASVQKHELEIHIRLEELEVAARNGRVLLGFWLGFILSSIPLASLLSDLD
jgi:hypothetical protein